MPKGVYYSKLKRRELFWVGTALDRLREAEQIDRAIRTRTGR
jgi:hypothetical protein